MKSSIDSNQPTKTEIKEYLDDISDMSKDEFKINYNYITKTAKDAYNLIRRMEITITKLNSKRKKDNNYKPSKEFEGV